jgi:hypothetical protein
MATKKEGTMNKYANWVLIGGAVLLSFLMASSVRAQKLVDPVELKIKPNSFKNSHVKIQDNYIHVRSSLGRDYTKAGYTLDKYIAFGASKSGMRCFMLRNSANEKLVAEFEKGTPMTIYGYIKQLKVDVGKGGAKGREKLDKYIIVVSKIEKGHN